MVATEDMRKALFIPKAVMADPAMLQGPSPFPTTERQSQPQVHNHRVFMPRALAAQAVTGGPQTGFQVVAAAEQKAVLRLQSTLPTMAVSRHQVLVLAEFWPRAWVDLQVTAAVVSSCFPLAQVSKVAAMLPP